MQTAQLKLDPHGFQTQAVHITRTTARFVVIQAISLTKLYWLRRDLRGGESLMVAKHRLADLSSIIPEPSTHDIRRPHV